MKNQVLRDPENSDTTLRGRLNDSIKLHSLRGWQWRLGAVDMRFHDAERLAEPELQVLKLNSNGDKILRTPTPPKSVTRLFQSSPEKKTYLDVQPRPMHAGDHPPVQVQRALPKTVGQVLLARFLLWAMGEPAPLDVRDRDRLLLRLHREVREGPLPLVFLARRRRQWRATHVLAPPRLVAHQRRRGRFVPLPHVLPIRPSVRATPRGDPHSSTRTRARTGTNSSASASSSGGGSFEHKRRSLVFVEPVHARHLNLDRCGGPDRLGQLLVALPLARRRGRAGGRVRDEELEALRLHVRLRVA